MSDAKPAPPPAATEGPSPLEQTHADATRLGPPRLLTNQDLLRGRRSFVRPMMALTIKQDLGPVRHALSQMVVAGTMVVHPPFMQKEEFEKAQKAKPQSTVLTFTPPPLDKSTTPNAGGVAPAKPGDPIVHTFTPPPRNS